MKALRQVELFLAVALAASLSGCSQFFTTSLAAGLARDPADVIPTVTADNIDDLIEQSEGNPEMALAVLEGIGDAVDGASAADQATLRAAAVSLASTSSGVGVAVLNEAGTILDHLDDPDITGEIADVVGGLSNLGSTADALVAALPSPTDTAAFDAFVAQSSADDLAMAAVVLLSSQATASGDTQNYIDTFDSATATTTEELLAVKLATYAKAKSDAEGGDGTVGDLLDAVNLVNP